MQREAMQTGPRFNISMPDKRTMRAWLTVAVLGLLMLGPVAHALPPAKDYEAVPHTGTDYPVGTVELSLQAGLEVQLHYPALEEGVKTQMAGNGPFPVVVFIPTDGEGSGDYELFSTALVARGYVVGVMDRIPQSPLPVAWVLERIYDVNEGDGSVPGALDSMTDDWAIGGHGQGAAAALKVAGQWTGTGQNLMAPSSVFGLGLHDDGVHLEDGEVSEDALGLVFDEPAVGLLITGSVDEVAPVESNVLPLLNVGMDLGLHVMTLRGANHHQWQDSTGLFSGSDGTPTLTQEEQHAMAATHVVSLLDLTTRGDHDAFSVAFNRPNDPHVLSDADAYLDEDLTAAELLRVNLTSPTNDNGSDVSGTLEFRGQVGLWDGSDWHADARVAEALCWFDDATTTFTGTVNQTGWFSCDLDANTLQPGPFNASVRVSIDGAPVTRTLSLYRGNGPLEPLTPVPAVIVPQGGAAVLQADALAVDPDGLEVRFTSVQLEGANASRFEALLLPGASSVELRDASDVDWLGGALLNVSLSAPGETSPLQVSVQVRMGDVDNPVEVIGVPPTLVFDEDGAQQTLAVGDYVVDPEGMPLQVTVDGGMWTDVGPVRAAVMGSNLSVVPLANASGSVVVSLLVSDGFTDAVQVNVTVVVKPVNDAPRLNQTELLVVLAEDTIVDIDLAPLAWDADGDLPTVSVVEPPQALAVLDVADLTLQVRPLQHANGQVDAVLRFVFPDETLDLNVSITVEPVEDSGSIRLDWVRPLAGDQIEVRWTVEDRDALSNASFTGVMLDNNGDSLTQTGSPSCGPALLDDRGVPLWSVTCDSVWELPSSLVGMTLRVEELRPSSELPVVYVLPVEVEDMATAAVDDDMESSVGPVLFVGGAVVLAALGFLAWRAKD